MDKRNCPKGCPYRTRDFPTRDGIWPGKKVIFVAHRADERVLKPVLFGSDHEQALMETDSGRALHELLTHCGLARTDVFFTNILRCVLPEDQGKINFHAYRHCSQHLNDEIIARKPRAIVTFGKPSYLAMFDPSGSDGFLQKVGTTRTYQGVPTLVEHHLSKLHRLEKPGHYDLVREFLTRSGVFAS